MGSNVNYPVPLTRFNTLFPGQVGGVPGVATETGLRLHPTGTIFYVDPNFPGASDARDGTDPNEPLLTVAAAVALCQPYRGDVIFVGANSAWTHGDSSVGYATQITEDLTIDVAGVRLIGVFPSSSIGVPWTPATATGFCISITAMDVLVEGFMFMGGAAGTGNGIYAEWDGATLWGDDAVIRNNYFDEDIDTAIQLEFSWFTHVHNNIFQACETGILVDTAGSGAAYLEIYENKFIDVQVNAMLIEDTDDSMVMHNYLFNADAQNAAAAANVFINTTGGARNLVAKNVMSCLLPVPANGDYDNANTAAASDAWVQNYCMDGPSVTNPT